jgi:syntaxin 8
MANPSQLYLLADHIKLSLLERQRAISLNLEPNSQDGHISRSLDSMREGIEALEQQPGNDNDTALRLRSQYDDLTSQFRGFPTTSTSSTVNQPNDPSLSSDFAHAKDTRPRIPSSSSFMKRSAADSPNLSKSVRFTDAPPDPEDEANRAALFPYRDEPEGPSDQSQLDNQQIHTYHKQVLQEQDDQLDRLGESIGRQRDLSIQIGDELDDHIQMLDDVEVHVDRHQSRLDGARRQLGNVARRARDNKQITVILILIIILVLLIIILRN